MIDEANRVPEQTQGEERPRLQRRRSDFANRGIILMDAGSTSTCCCCTSCLHWIGFAVGTVIGATRSKTELPSAQTMAAGAPPKSATDGREAPSEDGIGFHVAWAWAILAILLIAIVVTKVMTRSGVVEAVTVVGLFFVVAPAFALLPLSAVMVLATFHTNVPPVRDARTIAVSAKMWTIFFYAFMGMMIGAVPMIIIGLLFL